MHTSRRMFLKSGAMALVSVGLAPACGPEFLRKAVFAQEPSRARKASGGRKTLICIFQRGAVDGLSMVVPHGDPDYYRLRAVGAGGIALPRTGAERVLDLDGTFGLHPALAPLKEIYDGGHLAPIHAVGSPSTTRSHFDAQDFMECGSPDRALPEGWLSRALLNCPEDQARLRSTMSAVSLTAQLPRSLQGEAQALAIPDLRTFGVSEPRARAMGGGGMARPRTSGSDVAGGFESLYEGAVGDVLHGTGKESFEAMKLLKSITSRPYAPANGAQYPRGRFGDALQQIAQLIKADVGVEIAFAESGGWDTHVGQGGAQGQLAQRLREFGQGLAALYRDLGDHMDDTVILTMSEFGRTARQNGNGGTDHGHATCFLALGGSVRGGRVLGQWPGLAVEQLYEGRDLAHTTDFRDVFGEVAQRHLGVTDLGVVFPGRTFKPASFRGLLRAT
jgi:uncharacterized protein (DUF1501 family)